MFFPGSPLNYPTNSLAVIRRYESDRAPNTLDNRNFNLGDEWLDTSTNQWYKLAAKPQGVADWCLLCQSQTSVESFIPDEGDSPILPDGAGEVTLTGGPVETRTIVTTGSPNTVTWELASNLPGDRCFTCPSPSEAAFCWDCTLGCTSLRGFSTGFSGSEWFTCQAGVQTVDASTVTLATIPVQDFTNLTMQGNCGAGRELNTAALTQTIIYGARRNGGGAIELSPSEGHFLSDGPGTVLIDGTVSGNDIIITATGEAGVTWNWVLTYSYMTVKTNA